MKNSKAQIIATLGPASKDKETIMQMAQHQMDVARLNFSWGTREEHSSYIQNMRDVAKELGKQIPIIQDLSGPRIQKEKEHTFDEESRSIITEKDLEDLKFGCEQKVDYAALSFVGEGNDIAALREEMKKIDCQIPIIAKIERKKALENLDDIIERADAIMIARGDLGNEIPLETIPFVQRTIIEKAKQARKPVITATEMLASMTENPRPTRAEVSDVAHAILDGSDGVMLSEETATGKYPVEAVTMMEKIVLEAEKHSAIKEINPL